MPDETPLYDYFPKSAESVIPSITAGVKTTNEVTHATPVKKKADEETVKSRVNKTAMPENLSLAIAYIVFQESLEMYSSDVGFERGTLFPDLFKPFTGKRGVME